MDSINFSMKIPCKKSYDVIVAGGGVAGCAAAIAAANNGLSVLLLEKSTILGGLGTLGLVNFFVPMDNGNGKQIIFGYAEKWLRQSTELGFQTIAEEWKDGEPKVPTHRRYAQHYSPYIFALQLLENVQKAGVDLLYDCVVSYPIMDGKTCKGVVIDGKSGFEYYETKMLIDTTGDADLLRRSGMPTVAGENYFTYIGKMLSWSSIESALEAKDFSKLYSFFTGGGINLFGDNQPADVRKWNGLTVEDVTDYLITNQNVMLEKIKALPKNEMDLVQLPLMHNLRTTCHIKGEASLKVSDCYKHVEDSIGAINDFEHNNHLFEVSYGTLINKSYPNMITAGRSADGTGYGWDLLRVIPPAIITGQAAGEAATLALKGKKDITDISIPELQKKLEHEDVMIHFPDEYVPEDKTVIIHGKDRSGHPEGHM